MQEDIAIIGMSCLFPGAPDLKTYWQNIISKVNCITDPPEDAWDSEIYYDPNSTENDRVYCKRGGYIGPLARFDPLEHGIMPTEVKGGEPDQWLALQTARDAFSDAGYQNRPPEGHRTAVILGKGNYLNRGNLSLVQNSLVVDQTLKILKTLHPEYTSADLAAIRQEMKQCLPDFSSETVAGLIPNIIAGRIANRLDLMGPCYTVDGACASSLLAIDIAMRELIDGKIDLALVGGSQVTTPVPILGIFCQLNALSRKEQIRPFDKEADGTILGEGIGMIVLKRRSDAERDGNRIYALVKGVGTSSDGRGLGVLAPRSEGQALALQRAYETACVSPGTIALIEAHGTGTPVGDMAEIQTLKQIFGPRNNNVPWCAVGSIKSMIGHAMPAAGIAGVIKAALSLYHKVLPPTLNVEQPNPEFALEGTPFYINTETRPWIHGSQEAPRRAGVNAFGFGGINAHAILEEYNGGNEFEATYCQYRWDTEVFILQGKSRDELINQGKQLQRYLSEQPHVDLKDLAYTLNSALSNTPYRLSIVASSLQELEAKLAHALKQLADKARKQIKDRQGIYFFEQPLDRQ
jgi:acyl transferase domain-containing protein